MPGHDELDDDRDDDDWEAFLDARREREEEEEEWKCVLGKDCLVASPFHHSSECFDREMAERMFADQDEPPHAVYMFP